jgi:hypothetical protein
MVNDKSSLAELDREGLRPSSGGNCGMRAVTSCCHRTAMPCGHSPNVGPEARRSPREATNRVASPSVSLACVVVLAKALFDINDKLAELTRCRKSYSVRLSCTCCLGRRDYKKPIVNSVLGMTRG